MRNYKHLLALLLTVCMLLCMIPAVAAEEAVPLATEDEVVIYYTNDVHTYIDKDLSYDNIADLKAQTAMITDTLLLDAGDHIQGTAYGSMDKGATIVELMEAAGYDLATLGNHEFDYDMERALEVATGGTVSYVSCNFYHEENGVAGESVLPSFQLFETKNGNVAVIGITTPETFTKSTPAYFQDEEGNYIYGIAGGEDGSELYAAVQAAIDEASQVSDIVIALAHLGDDVSSQPWTSEEVIANTVGLDAVIDGHSHSTVPMKEVKDKAGNTVVLTQTGEYFNAIGRMSIDADGSITTGLISIVEVEDPETEEVVETYVGLTGGDGETVNTGWELGSDAGVKEIKDAWIAEIEAQLGTVIGVSEVDLLISDEDGRQIRSREMNIGDFCADALYYLFDNMDMDVDVAIMNGGGIRANAEAGEISYETCKTVHTFGNVACLQTITGQQLLDALEWGAKNVGTGENGGFLQVSGVTYEIHTYIEPTVQYDDKGVWTGGPTGEYRVKNVKILQDGEYVDLDLEAEYNLAGYNYTLRDLGDGFAMFDGAVNVLDYVMEDYLVLANYVKSFPVNEATGLPTIAQDSIYAETYGEGRIRIVDDLAQEDEIVIYYTNDVHTYIDGETSYDNIAALKTATGLFTDNVLLVDAGDHIQGTAYGSMDKGETIIELMNAAGYDLATLGNHEFDYTMEGAMNAIEWAEFPYVSANFYHEKDGVAGETVLDAYQVFEMGDTKIAFIGVTTPETFTKSTPAYFQDGNGNYIYGIAGGDDGAALYAAVQEAIDEAAKEADIIIALAHLGDDPASQPWTSEELIANTTGLDALIDGHSHSTVEMKEVKDKAGNVVVLTQTGEYFGAIGRMSITEDGIKTELLDGFGGSDAAVAQIQNEWIESVNEQLGKVIGKAEVTFDNYDADGNRLVRKQETNTGDFAADALYYLFEDMGLDVDVAIMNGGGVRNKAITGDISYLTCKNIHTFGNVACLQTITGQQLLDALEWGARSTADAECGGFLHVSGITYEIHTYIESTVQADDKGVWTGGPTGEYRVKNVKILQDGEYVALDLEAEYNLAGYNYTLRDLGDGFAMFDGAVNVLDYVMEDYMVLANYVKSFDNGVIPADSIYADVNGEGRIVLVNEQGVDLSVLDEYDDVELDRYYSEALAYMVSNKIMNGVTEKEMAPNATLTRGMLVTILYRMEGEPSVEGLVNPFSDVKEGKYYTDAVIWAASEGIVNGKAKDSFAPADEVTREQIAAILYRYSGSPQVTGDLSAFADGDKVSNYAKDAVAWATEIELIKGIAEGSKLNVDAKGSATRAQAATILYRWLEK